jgi:hypothetical protein
MTDQADNVAALKAKRDEYHNIANLLSEFAAELVEKFLEMEMELDDDDLKAKCQAYADGGYRALEAANG